MVRVIVPNADAAARLCEIEQAAFAGRQTRRSVEGFMAICPPRGAILADNDVAHGLLVLQFAADEGEIIDLGTVPAVRRTGLARDLMQAGEALACDLGCRRLVLEVAVDNAAARALYGSLDYQEAGRRKAYYLRPDGSRMDALVLAKDLPPRSAP
ncbi:MAG: GNAT family N-acetyltransferase [Pseudomonadota bacterium]